MTPVLEVSHVTVRFGGVTAVEDVSLEVAPGELMGFIGPNGAGKTTLMRVITGIVRPQAGSVRLDGVRLDGLAVHERIGRGLALAQQIVQPIRAMSLRDNVALACGAGKTGNALTSMFRADRRRERERAGELLALVGLAAETDAMPDTVPLGALKRLEVARAMALEPKLLLLDEPLAGLNQQEAAELADLIAALNRRGQAILLIEHNLREVMRICPRLYVQDNGRPLAVGAARDVMADPAVRTAYLGGEHGC